MRTKGKGEIGGMSTKNGLKISMVSPFFRKVPPSFSKFRMGWILCSVYCLLFLCSPVNSYADGCVSKYLNRVFEGQSVKKWNGDVRYYVDGDIEVINDVRDFGAYINRATDIRVFEVDDYKMADVVFISSNDILSFIKNKSEYLTLINGPNFSTIGSTINKLKFLSMHELSKSVYLFPDGMIRYMVIVWKSDKNELLSRMAVVGAWFTALTNCVYIYKLCSNQKSGGKFSFYDVCFLNSLYDNRVKCIGESDIHIGLLREIMSDKVELGGANE